MTSQPCVRTLVTHMGDGGISMFCVPAGRGRRKSGMHCYPLLSEEVSGKWSSCREWWLCPPHSYKPPLYCGWEKLNAFSQAFNFVVRPFPSNNILYFLASHCIFPDILVLYLAYIHLTSTISVAGFWPLTWPPVLFHCKTPGQPVSALVELSHKHY